MKKVIRTPSPAMVVALIALFVALGGSVYAANKLSGKTIKKGSEPGNRLKKNTVTGVQVNESTLAQVPLAANASKLGGKGLNDIVMSALFDSSGILVRGTPGVTTTQTASPGRYMVTFPRDVSNCIYNATPGTPATSNGSSSYPTPQVSAAVGPSSQSPNAIIVATAVTNTGTLTDNPAYVAVHC